MNINWTVTPEEADYILKVLAQRPYTEVGTLIPKLLQQANPPKTVELREPAP